MSKVTAKIKWTGPETVTVRLSGSWAEVIAAMHPVAQKLKEKAVQSNVVGMNRNRRQRMILPALPAPEGVDPSEFDDDAA